MRPVRVLLIAIALVAVGITGWALARGDGYANAGADPAVDNAAPAQSGSATLPLRGAEPGAGPVQAVPDDATMSDTPSDTGQPAPRPRIAGFGSEPVLPEDGAFWRLSPGAGLVTFVLDAQHSTRVEFWLTPTGTGVGDLSRKIGQDTNGRDGWLFNWRYPNEPILGHLTVRAIGPGGIDEETVGVYHPDPAEQP
jgi:hypothetical protein